MLASTNHSRIPKFQVTPLNSINVVLSVTSYFISDGDLTKQV